MEIIEFSFVLQTFIKLMLREKISITQCIRLIIDEPIGFDVVIVVEHLKGIIHINIVLYWALFMNTQKHLICVFEHLLDCLSN